MTHQSAHMSHKKEKTALLSITITDCLIGILVMMHDNPHITGQYNPLYPLYTPKEPGLIHCSHELKSTFITVREELDLHMPMSKLAIAHLESKATTFRH